MNNGMTNLVIGTSHREAGVTVTHLARGVEYGQIVITYERGQVTNVRRIEDFKLTGGLAGENVTRLI